MLFSNYGQFARRLKSAVEALKKNRLRQYGAIIQGQMKKGVIDDDEEQRRFASFAASGADYMRETQDRKPMVHDASVGCGL
ncbi:unnamed protein product [Toxocara canis]|uniref:Mitochondrial zinc maintenance protein 1, mitochondrial n=1 Tax=Toxocara canis TaxID=6265 RepID=A0A183UVT4_TOXCA|nr:unnamed protein product [Toxocara canis]